jgi:hypothetical protein
MTRARGPGVLMLGGVPVGAFVALTYEPPIVIRAGARGGKRLGSLTAHAVGTWTDDGTAWQALADAVAAGTPEQRGCDEGARRAWARYAAARSARWT